MGYYHFWDFDSGFIHVTKFTIDQLFNCCWLDYLFVTHITSVLCLLLKCLFGCSALLKHLRILTSGRSTTMKRISLAYFWSIAYSLKSYQWKRSWLCATESQQTDRTLSVNLQASPFQRLSFLYNTTRLFNMIENHCSTSISLNAQLSQMTATISISWESTKRRQHHQFEITCFIRCEQLYDRI